MSLVKWVGGSSKSFGDAKNWNPQVVPGATSDILMQPAAAVTITAANATINSLTTSANATLSIAATDTFTVIDAVDAANPTGTSVNGGTIKLGLAADLFLSGTFKNTGVLATAPTSDVWLNGKLINSGSVTQSGDFNIGNATTAGKATNAAGAHWSVNGNVDIIGGTAAGSTFTNNGAFTRTGAGVTDVTVATINAGNVTAGSGALEFIGGLTNTGTITASGAALYVSRPIAGTGMLDIGGFGNLHLLSGADAGQTVNFLGAGELDLNAPGVFAGHIAGFGTGDVVDLVNKAATSTQFAGGVLTVLNGSAPVAHLNFIGSYTNADFSLVSAGSLGTQIHFV